MTLIIEGPRQHGPWTIGVICAANTTVQNIDGRIVAFGGKTPVAIVLKNKDGLTAFDFLGRTLSLARLEEHCSGLKNAFADGGAQP